MEAIVGLPGGRNKAGLTGRLLCIELIQIFCFLIAIPSLPKQARVYLTNTPTLYPTGRGHRASENPVEARHLVSGIMLGY